MKVALITGAGRGIGAACALEFAQAGYKVVLAERDEASGRQLEADLRSAGFEAWFVQTDVTQEESIQSCIGAAIGQYGHIDVLINNAGRNRRTPLLETSNQDWHSSLILNLSSVFWACKHAMPHLLVSKGAVVNVSSLVGLQGQPEAVAYAAAKGGVIALTKTLALDFAPKGVRVNAICPGDIRTPQYDEWLAEQTDGAAVLEAIQARLPVGRMGTPQETARAILFLSENQFANGVILVLDGGKILG